jgi:rhodanese-related sulfurtransferase
VSTPNGSSESNVGYAGDINPEEAWNLLASSPDAVLVDVRTEDEWKFVGVPDIGSLGKEAVLVQWNTAQGRNANFLAELGAHGVITGPVLFLCRSGHRSISAAKAATAAGIAPSFNITQGFEGPLDPTGHRGGSGWKASGLPWKQT